MRVLSIYNSYNRGSADTAKLTNENEWFLFQHPKQTYGYAVIFSLTGYLGLNFVLCLVKLSGALIAVTGE